MISHLTHSNPKVILVWPAMDKIVHAAVLRGVMVPVEEDQVFCDPQGRKVLNGAGGARKMKQIGGEEKAMQRFISTVVSISCASMTVTNFCRAWVSTLLEQGPDEVYLVDGEDLTSCFNLATWPPRDGLCSHGGGPYGLARARSV